MAYNINISQQQTRDELGSESDVNFAFKRFSEKAKLIHGPTKIKQRGISNSFILNSSANGILGTSLLGDRRESGTIHRIENGSNIFNERFFLTDYIESTTGSINYTTGLLTLGVGEAITSNSAFYDRTGTKVLYSATPSIPISGTFTIYISADGWSTASSVTNNATVLFTSGVATSTFNSGIFDTVRFDNAGIALAGSDMRIYFSNSGASSVTTKAYSVAYVTY